MRKLYEIIITKFHGCILMNDETYQYSDTNQTIYRQIFLLRKEPQ